MSRAPRPSLPTPVAPCIPAVRRAVVGAVWALCWMLAWGAALLFFPHRARAETLALALAVSDGPVSLPIYVAQARNLFQDEGLAVRLQPCRSGRDGYRLLAEGGVDVATAAELVVASGSAARPDIAIIATISASSSQIKVVARRSAHVSEAPQLHGRRVGTVPGTSAQYFLDNWLIYNDVDPRSIVDVPLAPEDLVAAIARREVDAVAIWEPLASNAATTLGPDAVVFASPRVYTQHFNLVTSRATIERREAELVRLLRALIRAQRFIVEQPAAAQAILAARLGLAPPAAAAAMVEQDYRVRLDQSLVTTMQSEARWAVRRGAARSGDLLHAIEPGPLRRAAPEAVGLVH